jgi:hypothetical protein
MSIANIYKSQLSLVNLLILFCYTFLLFPCCIDCCVILYSMPKKEAKKPTPTPSPETTKTTKQSHYKSQKTFNNEEYNQKQFG